MIVARLDNEILERGNRHKHKVMSPNLLSRVTFIQLI